MATTGIAATERTVEETTKGFMSWFRKTFSGDFLDVSWVIGRTLLLLLVCLVVKRLILASMSRLLAKTRMERGLQTFVRGICNVLLWLTTIIILADSLQISMTLPLAAFGVVGLALSLAVQDSLSNLAGGINILASRPFVVGDYIEIDTDGGTVHEIGMIHTTLRTVDHRRIVLPNNKVMSARVINYSAETLRRVDLPFSTSYEASIASVQKAILDMLHENPHVIEEPAPEVIVKCYGESTIDYGLRAWCTREDYWELYYALLAEIKPALDLCAIEMSYPHLNVHLREPRSPKA